VQALAGLRELLGYDAAPADFDVAGDLAYVPLKSKLEELQVMALRERPDLQAAVLGVTAAQSQILLAKANAKVMISNTSKVWVLVNVYQKDLPFVRTGDAVTIQTDAFPDVFQGRISYVAASLDPTTRTLQARIQTSNPGEKLKKDMYVTATVQAGTIKNAIAVPDAAVLRDSENQPFVYAELSPNQFGMRSVTLGDSQKGQTQITSGLTPGDRVIGDGSLFLQFANSLQR
jgi:RND family efflux transporter MFP subunit